MKFSTKTRYGIRAMLEIASDETQSGVFQKDIAERQQISVKYLDQIIHALKAANLIVNLRGRKSGYILTRSSSEITMLDIHRAFEPGICVIDCLSSSIECDREAKCRVKGFWGELNNRILHYFKSVTLQDMLDGKIKLD
ncbi:RrF2 family transcriptional regulator [Sunxiuqinia sp. A32]|uniref:RrF2 family transcriptional regulator n=1 Tax=Sunxiuqinia sp. A32 TaxID=3461496 RepID=UPI0040453708